MNIQSDKPEILTVQEVADFLRVSERTVYDWATGGVIPCGKLGTTWRFKRVEVEKWVDEQLAGGSTKKNVTFSPVSLKDILSSNNVMMINANGKESFILQMIDHLAANKTISHKEKIVEGIFQREKLMSTGIGLGIGIPHVRLSEIDQLVMAVALAREPLEDYESLDGEPVRLVFMILAGINQQTQHVKTMAAISSRVRNPVLREMVMQADDTETIYNLLTHGGQVK